MPNKPSSSRSDLAVLQDWKNIAPIHPFSDSTSTADIDNQSPVLQQQKLVNGNNDHSYVSLRQQQSAAMMLSLTNAFSDLQVIPNSSKSLTSTDAGVTDNNTNNISKSDSMGTFVRSESYSSSLAANQNGSKVFRKNNAAMGNQQQQLLFAASGSSRPGSMINRSFNVGNGNNNSAEDSFGGSSSFVRVATMYGMQNSTNNNNNNMPHANSVTSAPSTAASPLVTNNNPSESPTTTFPNNNNNFASSYNMSNNNNRAESSQSPTEDLDSISIPSLHSRVLGLREKYLVRDDETCSDNSDDVDEEDEELAAVKKIIRSNNRKQFFNMHNSFPFSSLIAALATEEDNIVKEARASSRGAGDNEEQVSAGGGLVGLLRSAVSQNKNRFQQDGFDLDLTYITPRIIAMGFPSSGAEAFYRNPMDQVEVFFKRRHTSHYRVYNLCSERQYDNDKLEGRWKRYPFDDHNAPSPMRLMPSFVQDATKFLRDDPKNVVAIHCKAGKGRTGVMIACLLMALVPSLREPSKALHYFASQRTDDAQGVTIASQIRYVHYFGTMLAKHHGEEPLPGRTLSLQKIVVWSPIRLAYAPLTQIDNIFIVVEENGEKKLDSLETSIIKTFRTDDGFGGGVHYVFERSGKIPLLRNICGDIRVIVNIKTMLGKDELFHYWFNTTLCNPQAEAMSKFELDKACKDHKNQVYCPELMAQTFFIDAPVKKPMKHKPLVAPPEKKKKALEAAAAVASSSTTGGDGNNSNSRDNSIDGDGSSNNKPGNSPPQSSNPNNTGSGDGAKGPEKKEEKGFFTRLFGR